MLQRTFYKNRENKLKATTTKTMKRKQSTNIQHAFLNNFMLFQNNKYVSDNIRL